MGKKKSREKKSKKDKRHASTKSQAMKAKKDMKKSGKKADKRAKVKKKIEDTKLTYCPCCKKHCPLTKPKCGKGRKLAAKLGI